MEVMDPMGLMPQAMFTTPRRISVELQRDVAITGIADAIVILEQSAAAATLSREAMLTNTDLLDAFVIDEDAPVVQTARGLGNRTKALARAVKAGVFAVDGGSSAIPTRHAPRVQAYDELGVLVGAVDMAGLGKLAAHPQVRYVCSAAPFSLIRPRESTATSPVKLAKGTTWGIDALRIPELWAAGLTGKGVLIGHLDTGADSSHPMLADAVDSFLFVEKDGLPGSAAKAYDTGWHGTHTAATIAGRGVSGRFMGVAPEAKLAVATVIEGGQIARRVITALNWAVKRGVRILNLSFGLRGFRNDFMEVMQLLRPRNVLPVVAVGNEGPGTSRSPGNYEVVLSVGACDKSNAVWADSSSQHLRHPVDRKVPDVVGPGVAVLSAVPGNDYDESTGSSMATPHITGLAALLMQAAPSAHIDEIQRVILESAQVGTMDPDRCGRGLPDAVVAFQLLTGGLPVALPSTLAKPRTKRKEKTTTKPRTRRASITKGGKSAARNARGTRR